MIIRTKKKDFYDRWQHVYGQDPNIIWDRDVITRDERLLFGNLPPQASRSIFRTDAPLEKFGLPDFRPDAPVVLSRLLLPGVSVLGTPTVLHKGEILSERTLDRLWKDAFTGSGRPWLPETPWEEVKRFTGAESADLLKVHRALNAPIFSFHIGIHGYLHVDNEIPILSEIPGFVKKAGDPGVFYQRIYNFFIENRANTDLEPPVEVDNKSKILKAGFDMRTSFRHPVRL